MKKRTVLFGTFDTAAQGIPWTLTSIELTSPETKTNYVDIPGANGTLDLSCAVSGEPVFNDRELTLTFETSEGTRAERENAINDLFNQLHGNRMHIILPDAADYYLDGRIGVSKDYNDMAHAAVTITAVCSPYRRKVSETTITKSLTTTQISFTLTNSRMPVVPTITVTAQSAVTFEDTVYTLNAGTHALPAIRLSKGANTMKAKAVSGTGSITITYREGML